MTVVDEDLRHGGAAARLLDHLRPLLGLHLDVDLGEGGAFFLEKRLRSRAVGAPALRVDRDGRHRRHVSVGQERTYRKRHPSVTTLAKTRTSTTAAPPRRRAREAAFAVAPVVSTSSTRTTRLPSSRARASAGTRNAPCRFSCRCARVSPTCRRVRVTRASRKGSQDTRLAAETCAAS